MQPPRNRPGFHLYRSDGAARGQGRTRATNTSLRQNQGSSQTIAPIATKYGCMADETSNNVAEYTGLLEAVRHAMTMTGSRICFQVGSMLVAMQVCRTWACRSLQLTPLLQAVWQGIRELENRNGAVIVEHIYREYNVHADQLANQALDTQAFQDCMSCDTRFLDLWSAAIPARPVVHLM
jgi:ribonuclease HI